MAPKTEAAPDMSCFISSMPPAVFSERPPESKVIPLPIRAIVPLRLRAAVAPCSSTIMRGGRSLPWPTARIAPMPRFSISVTFMTEHLRPTCRAILRASRARDSG